MDTAVCEANDTTPPDRYTVVPALIAKVLAPVLTRAGVVLSALDRADAGTILDAKLCARAALFEAEVAEFAALVAEVAALLACVLAVVADPAAAVAEFAALVAEVAAAL